MVELTTAARLLAIAPNPSVDRLLTVDALRHGEIHRPTSVTVVPGGKGFNLARAALTLGAPVTAAGLLGGAAGDWIAGELRALGIEVVGVPRQGETRTCTSIRDRSDGTMTEIYEAGPPIGTDDWNRFVSVLATRIDGPNGRDKVGLVAVSGSLPPGAPDAGLAQIVLAARSSGLRTAIDGQGAALIGAFEARPWLVKVNIAEARATGLGSPPPAAASGDVVDEAAGWVRALLEAGAERAVVTIGTAGAVASTESSLLRVRPSDLGRYPVGAGDAFLAGLMVAALRQMDDRDGLVLAAAAAAASALVPGAGRLSAADVERIRPRIRIDRLS